MIQFFTPTYNKAAVRFSRSFFLYDLSLVPETYQSPRCGKGQRKEVKKSDKNRDVLFFPLLFRITSESRDFNNAPLSAAEVGDIREEKRKSLVLKDAGTYRILSLRNGLSLYWENIIPIFILFPSVPNMSSRSYQTKNVYFSRTAKYKCDFTKKKIHQIP